MSSMASSLFLAFVLGIALGPMQDSRTPGFAGSESVFGLVGKTDASTILRTWRLKGVLACVSGGRPRVCLWVENAYPCGIVEVVRQPGATHLSGLRLFGTSSSHTARSESGTALQFAEARVYTFIVPFILGDTDGPIAMPRGPLFAVNYVSEVDGWGWRTGIPDLLTQPAAVLQRAGLPSCSTVPDLHRCAGRWGGYFPRIGFLQHPSEVMTAYLLALRAGRVANAPLGRVVLGRYPFEPRTGHYIQMIRPVQRPSVPIGFPLVRALEQGAGSREGAYLFLHFGLFEECKRCLPPRLLPSRAPGPS